MGLNNDSPQRKTVALIIETSNGYARGILRGIRHFIQENPRWSIYLAEHGRHEVDNSFPDGWDGSGVIARIETERIADLVRRMDVPTVDVSAARLIPGIPWVETDDLDITRIAIDHLMGCGLHNIAYFGDSYYNWSKWRCKSFIDIARRNGLNPHVFNLPERSQPMVNWYRERDSIHAWIESLPKPVGIFACYDACGQQILEVCRYNEIQVPEAVAVVGVDNDELLCDLSYPPLSSVIPNAFQTGFLAAELLDRMMAGQPVPAEKHSIRALGVKKRISTDVLAVDDKQIAQSVTYMHEHAGENIKVDDILRVVPLSRRVFERRFKKALNRTPHRELNRIRIEHARALLLQTDMQVGEIAERLGFRHTEYLTVMFKQETGITPREFRMLAQG
ncbi:MAG TPA: XylR family transcriptional regulator [Spirochaetia bacterium]|nr:XylR family transcriptional regulator [Spirochaetia bacterium]